MLTWPSYKEKEWIVFKIDFEKHMPESTRAAFSGDDINGSFVGK